MVNCFLPNDDGHPRAASTTPSGHPHRASLAPHLAARAVARPRRTRHARTSGTTPSQAASTAGQQQCSTPGRQHLLPITHRPAALHLPPAQDQDSKSPGAEEPARHLGGLDPAQQHLLAKARATAESSPPCAPVPGAQDVRTHEAADRTRAIFRFNFCIARHKASLPGAGAAGEQQHSSSFSSTR